MITDDDKSPGRTTSDDSFNDVLKNMKKQTQLLQEIESNTEDMSNVQLEIKNELLRTNLGENKSKVSSTSKSGTEVDESSSWLSKLAKFSLGAAITGAIGWLFSTENPEIKNVREKAQKEVSEFLQSSIKDVYKWIKDSVSNTFNSIFGDSKESEERRKTIISTLGDIFTGISKFILEGFTTAFEFIKKKFENGETMEGAAWTVAAIALISKVVPDIILDLAKNIIGALKNVAVLALRGALTPAGLAAIAVAAAGAVGWQIGSMIYNTATDIPNNPTKEEADRNIKPDFPTVAVRSGGPSPEEQKSDLNERIKKQKQEIDILQETLQRQLEANQREYDKIPESVDEETRNKLQLEILNRSGISSVSKAKLDAENKLKELQDKLKELNDAADDDGKNKPKVSANEQTARIIQQTDQSIGANRQKPTAQQTDTPQGGGGDEQPQKQKNPARALVGNPNIKLMGIPRGREDVAMMIYNKFREAGFSDIQARAAIANAIRESSLNPAAKHKDSPWYGLFQINTKGGLGTGHNPSDLLTAEYNIDLIIKEAKRSKAFKASTNIQDAVAAFVSDVERPANKQDEIRRRTQIALGLSGTTFEGTQGPQQNVTPIQTNPVINTTRSGNNTPTGVTAPLSLGIGSIRNNDPAFIKIIEQLTMLSFGKSPFLQ